MRIGVVDNNKDLKMGRKMGPLKEGKDNNFLPDKLLFVYFIIWLYLVIMWSLCDLSYLQRELCEVLHCRWL